MSDQNCGCSQLLIKRALAVTYYSVAATLGHLWVRNWWWSGILILLCWWSWIEWSGNAFINLFGGSLKNSFKNSIKEKKTTKKKYCILDLIWVFSLFLLNWIWFLISDHRPHILRFFVKTKQNFLIKFIFRNYV